MVHAYETRTMSKNTTEQNINAAIKAQRDLQMGRAAAAKGSGGNGKGEDTLVNALIMAVTVLKEASPLPLHYKEIGHRAGLKGYTGTQVNGKGTPIENTLYAAMKQEAEEVGKYIAFHRGGVFGLMRDVEHHTEEAIQAAKPKASRTQRAAIALEALDLDALLAD